MCIVAEVNLFSDRDGFFFSWPFFPDVARLTVSETLETLQYNKKEGGDQERKQQMYERAARHFIILLRSAPLQDMHAVCVGCLLSGDTPL